MVKIVFIAVCLIAVLSGSSTSTNIECSFGIGTYSVVGSIYQCSVNNNPNILTEESAQISEISGTHQSSKSNDDVLGFYAESEIIQVFPKGLDKFFKNIKMIWIKSCQLKEIHQSDLKVFPNLVYFFLTSNEIEVIEEGLFDFNHNLEAVGFLESKIIHVDPNVFDHLNKLRYFWFSLVPCVAQDISDSREKVQSAIKAVKSKCSNSDFLSLDTQIENLEIESKTLNSEEFNVKLADFEKSSEFLKSRLLNSKVQNLKVVGNKSKIEQIQEVKIFHKNDTFLGNSLTVITDKFEDLKSSQCGLKNPIDEFKFTQNEIQVNLDTVKSTVTKCHSKFDQIQNSQNQFKDLISSNLNHVIGKVDMVQETLKESIGQTKTQINSLKSALASAKSSIDSIASSQGFTLSNLTSKFNELKKDIKSTQDEIKLSISDIVATLSDHTKFQIEAKDSFVKIRTVQNEIKKSLNDLSVNRNDNPEDRLLSLNEGIDFEAKIEEKLEKNEKGFAIKLHKMSINFDEKVKGIEKRMMKKFEDILEEKLGNLIVKNQD